MRRDACSSDSPGACVPCPSGSFKGETGTGAEGCVACAAGKYAASTSGASACASCGAHAHSPAASWTKSNCTCNAGYEPQEIYFGQAVGPCVPQAPRRVSVDLGLVLPLSRQVFDDKKQQGLVDAVAATAGAAAADVRIVAISPLVTTRRRLLAPVSIQVDLEINVQDEARASSLKDAFSMDRLNSHLVKQGLPPAKIVSGWARAPVVTTPPPLPPEPAAESILGMSLAAAIAAGAGLAVTIGGLCFCFWQRQRLILCVQNLRGHDSTRSCEDDVHDGLPPSGRDAHRHQPWQEDESWCAAGGGSQANAPHTRPAADSNAAGGDEEGGGEEEACMICKREYEDGDELRELPCGHSFHAACVHKWLLRKGTCPKCRINIHHVLQDAGAQDIAL